MLTDILDRLSGIAAVKDRINDFTIQLAEIRKVVLEQQQDVAGLQGQLKALIQMQANAGKRWIEPGPRWLAARLAGIWIGVRSDFGRVCFGRRSGIRWGMRSDMRAGKCGSGVAGVAHRNLLSEAGHPAAALAGGIGCLAGEARRGFLCPWRRAT